MKVQTFLSKLLSLLILYFDHYILDFDQFWKFVCILSQIVARKDWYFETKQVINYFEMICFLSVVLCKQPTVVDNNDNFSLDKPIHEEINDPEEIEHGDGRQWNKSSTSDETPRIPKVNPQTTPLVLKGRYMFQSITVHTCRHGYHP